MFGSLLQDLVGVTAEEGGDEWKGDVSGTTHPGGHLAQRGVHEEGTLFDVVHEHDVEDDQ